MSESPNAPLIVYGGTFDPVHLGHLHTITAVSDRLGGAQVLWLPAGQPPHRPAPVASTEQRLAMLKIAIAEEPRFVIDTRELHRPGPSYTVLSLAELKTQHPGRCLCLALGLDAALALPDWHRWEEILQLASILVMFRPGWSLPNPLPPWWVAGDLASADDVTLHQAGWMTTIEVPAVDISAAMVRTALAGGKTIDRQVPVAIAQYIEEHGLYE